MRTRVIAIARQVGTGGEVVAQHVADRLGYRYVDYQIIQQAAQEAGVSTETVSEAEHSPSLLTRVLESLARNPSAPSATWADPVPLTTHPLLTSADYRAFVADVIRDLGEKGECVIVGHAAHRVLRERADTFRVLVTGSLPYRIRTVMARMATDEKTARKTVERTDADRANYFRRFYDIDWLHAPHYELCISGDTFELEQVADLIVHTAKLR